MKFEMFTLSLTISFAIGSIDAITSALGSRPIATFSIIDIPRAIVTKSLGRMIPYFCMSDSNLSRTSFNPPISLLKLLKNKSRKSRFNSVVSMS